MTETDSGTWFVMHPDELMVSFYIPLLDSIGLPAGTLFRSSEQLETSSKELLDRSSIELFFGMPLNGEYEIHPFPERFQNPTHGNVGSPVYWANKYVLSSSVLVHQLKANIIAKTSLDAALAVSNATAGRPMSIHDIAEVSEQIRRGLLNDSANAIENTGTVTVLECAVGLRLIGHFDADQIAFVAPIDATAEEFAPLESDQVHPSLISMWSWLRIGPDFRESSEVGQRRIQNALDIALEACRSIQRSYYVATGHPISLIYRERLPFIIPATVRPVSSIGSSDAIPQRTVVIANTNARDLETPTEIADVSKVHVIRGQLITGPLAAHSDLHREARVAYHQQGDMRATAIFSAVSAESFLDELLLHLMWEEARTPENAATDWLGKLSNRVKREYSSRLGGTWDLTQQNAVGNWHTEVGHLRNRVVHAAYSPSAEEAASSLRSLDGLVKYVGDLLAKPENLKKYPRTCITLLGDEEMIRRGIQKQWVLDLQNNIGEPSWRETFQRWLECWRRVRRDLNGSERIPDPSRAHVLATIKSDGVVEWVLHDRLTAMARHVSADISSLSQICKTQLDAIIVHVGKMPEGERFSVYLHDSPRWSTIEGGDWVEEYHWVPLTQVMVDRSDYSR